MENEVVIHVRARGDEARRGFADIERDAKRVGKSSGDHLSTGMSGTLMRTFGKLGEGLTDALGGASAKLPGMLSGAVSALPPQGQAIALVLVAGLAAALAPMLAAAISVAVLAAVGGGVLVAGIMSAAQDPKVKAAFGEFGKTAKDVFKDFGEPFREPLVRAAKTFTKLLKDIGPTINELGEIIAPVIDELAPALAEMFKQTLPGIKDAVKASVPLFETLAEHLPDIGRAISRFFSAIAKSGPQANQFFSDLLTFVEGLIIVLGETIGWLAKFYSQSRASFVAAGRAVEWLADKIGDVIGWIRRLIDRVRGIPGSVRGAANSAGSALANAFRNAATRAVTAIRNMASNIARAIRNIPKTITINIVQRLSTIGKFLSPALGLAGMFAHGGIVGAATGGLHGGLRMVGENGPELLDLPPGTQVHSNPDTQRLMSGGGSADVRLSFDRNAESRIVRALMEGLRAEIRAEGGNVQTVLGSA